MIGHMVTLNDFRILALPDSEFAELLLFDKDRERVTKELIKDLRDRARPEIRFVHTQEFVTYKGREVLLDLSAEEEGLRNESVMSVSHARELAASLGDVKVVVHPGGVHDQMKDRERLLTNLELSLSELGPSKLLLENMPWYYWHRKLGRMVANICVTIEDMNRFEQLVEGFTLDVCHGYLSRPEGNPEYWDEFLATLGRKTRHLHLSDARAPDKEGLQIGDGEIDFSILRRIDVPILVEIWKGHEQNGRGFKVGIERLRVLEKNL